MNKNISVLSDKQLILLFAYAPAGLGHLRVTDALYHGLPKDVSPLLLGSQDKSITVIHRLMSIHPITRALTEWGQQGVVEDIFTYFYRLFLKNHTKLLYQQVTTILDERIELSKTLLIVATHFGLAHQLGAIKQKLMNERKINVILVVQVTDDSPQHIWYVENADIIFVASEKTKEMLLGYGKKFGLKKVQFEVVAYPVTPVLGKELTQPEMEDRVRQVEPTSQSNIHVSIPISGAAVGTEFITKVVDELYKRSKRFVFHIVVKSTSYTSSFIYEMSKRTFVKLYISSLDREIVDRYENLYQKTVISLEITKPSEQTFKALYDCAKIGASLLLFSEPIGKQEYDNLDFLKRHALLPNSIDRDRLFKKEEDSQVLSRASLWRGIELPRNPKKAADFIWWCLQKGIFTSMMTCKVTPQKDDPFASEVNSDGVEQFWGRVCELLTTKKVG